MKPPPLTENQLRLANELWRRWKWDTLMIAEHFEIPEAAVWNCLDGIREYTPEVRKMMA